MSSSRCILLYYVYHPYFSAEMDNSNLFSIVRARKVLYYHRKTMVEKGVATVAQLFSKLCLHIVGERELEKARYQSS